MQSTTATELNSTAGLHKSPKLNRGTTLNKTTKLHRGTPAPGFTLSDAAGRRISLADFRGKSVIVYFYPRAATPGCTTEACDFRDSLAALQGAGFAVLGISPDAPEALSAFAAEHALTFPLLADEDHATALA
jgi:peroxiredoxin Q/BCP